MTHPHGSSKNTQTSLISLMKRNYPLSTLSLNCLLRRYRELNLGEELPSQTHRLPRGGSLCTQVVGTSHLRTQCAGCKTGSLRKSNGPSSGAILGYLGKFRLCEIYENSFCSLKLIGNQIRHSHQMFYNQSINRKPYPLHYHALKFSFSK